MIHLFLDACALVRRYFTDVGSRSIDQLLALQDAAYVTDILAIPEAAGALRGTLGDTRFPEFRQPEFDAAFGLLINHWRTQYEVLQIDEFAANDAMSLIYRHNLRGGDALHLALALRYNATVRSVSGEDAVVLVTSDPQFVSAAAAEGLKVFHFWRCQCPRCGLEFVPRKNAKTPQTHPGCDFSCRCGKDQCTSVYQITEEKLMSV